MGLETGRQSVCANRVGHECGPRFPLVEGNYAPRCSTPRCSCRQNNLPCTSACGQCQLDVCDNPHNRSILDEDDDQDSLNN